jgi:hypothetical protein
MAERLGVEPSGPLQVLQISNLLHYHPAHAPLCGNPIYPATFVELPKIPFLEEKAIRTLLGTTAQHLPLRYQPIKEAIGSRCRDQTYDLLRVKELLYR